MAGNLRKSIGSLKLHLISQRGIEKLEWIALAAVVLTLIGAVGIVLAQGSREIGINIVDRITAWVEIWGGGEPPVPGGEVSQPSVLGPGGAIQPGGGGNPITGPSIGVPKLIDSVVKPSQPGAQWKWQAKSGIQATKDYGWRNYTRESEYDPRTGKVKHGDWERQPSKVQVAGTIIDIKVSKGDSLWGGKIGDDKFYIKGDLGGYVIESSAQVMVDKNGFSANLVGKGGLYVAQAEFGGKLEHRFAEGYSVGIESKGKVYLGAEASGKVSSVIGKDYVAVGIGGEAFVGGMAEVESKIAGEIGGIRGGISGKAAVSYGIGAKFNADVGYKDGKVRVKLEIGATLGIGGKLGVGIEVDVASIGKKISDIGKSLVDLLPW